MKMLFTLHAGEVLTGQYIEHNYTKVKLWVPTKDTGEDFLVTGEKNKRPLRIQVKFSKDFLPGLGHEFEKSLRACGWYTLNRKKIAESLADYWILVLVGLKSSSRDFVIITPTELLRRLDAAHPKRLNTCHTHIWVTDEKDEKKRQCWETRDLKKPEKMLIAQSKKNKKKELNFTKYLNNWSPIKKLNGDMKRSVRSSQAI